jgi:hypothetical protein
LRRWSKDIRSKHLKRNTDEDVCSSKERFDRLYERTIEFIEEGSLSYESYNFACHTLGEALKQCATINQSLKIDKESVGKNNLRDMHLILLDHQKQKGLHHEELKVGSRKGIRDIKRLAILI